MDESLLTAHVDETGVGLPGGRRLYGLAAVLTRAEHRPRISAALTGLLLPGQTALHHYDETPARRLRIAEVIADCPLEATILWTTLTERSQQERARATLLSALLPDLQHREQVTRVCVESRAGSDKHDRRVRDRLRRSRRIDASMPVDHVRKDGDPLLWLPDAIAGFFVGAEFHGEPAAWQLANKHQLIEVRTLN